MAQAKRHGTHNKKSGVKPFYLILGLVAVLGGGFIAMSVMKNKQAANQPVEIDTSSSADLLQKAQGIERGPKDARVKVLVFADYTCPSCARHAIEFGPIMHDSILSTGKVQEVFFDFPLGDARVRGDGHRHDLFDLPAGPSRSGKLPGALVSLGPHLHPCQCHGEGRVPGGLRSRRGDLRRPRHQSARRRRA